MNWQSIVSSYYTHQQRFYHSHDTYLWYKSGTVNSKSLVGNEFLRIKWKYELTVHFKHEMTGKWKEDISQNLRIKWKFELTVPDLYKKFMLRFINFSQLWFFTWTDTT